MTWTPGLPPIGTVCDLRERGTTRVLLNVKINAMHDPALFEWRPIVLPDWPE